MISLCESWQWSTAAADSIYGGWKNSGPILSRLWTNVHEILGGCSLYGSPCSFQRPSPIVYSCIHFGPKFRGRLLARIIFYRLAKFGWVPFADLHVRSPVFELHGSQSMLGPSLVLTAPSLCKNSEVQRARPPRRLRRLDPRAFGARPLTSCSIIRSLAKLGNEVQETIEDRGRVAIKPKSADDYFGRPNETILTMKCQLHECL